VHCTKTGNIDGGLAKFINVDLLEDVPSGNYSSAFIWPSFQISKNIFQGS
jgi:hypothetical protein